MKVIVSYPKNMSKQAEIATKVAIVHADQIENYLQKLNCTKEQKIFLIDSIIAELKTL